MKGIIYKVLAVHILHVGSVRLYRLNGFDKLFNKE